MTNRVAALSLVSLISHVCVFPISVRFTLAESCRSPSLLSLPRGDHSLSSRNSPASSHLKSVIESAQVLNTSTRSFGIASSYPFLLSIFPNSLLGHSGLVLYNSPRLSSDPFLGPLRTFTTTSPFNHHECFLFQRKSRCSRSPTRRFQDTPVQHFVRILSTHLLPSVLLRHFHHTYLGYLRATSATEHVSS